MPIGIMLADDVDWTYENFLSFFKDQVGSKLSRDFVLSIPTDDATVRQIFRLTTEQGLADLRQAYPQLDVSPLATLKPLSHSLIVAPNHQIYALQHEAIKAHYLAFKKNNSRVKLAVNRANHLLIYKSYHDTSISPIAYEAGTALAIPAFNHYDRNKSLNNFHDKTFEFLYHLGEDLKNSFVKKTLTELDIISFIAQSIECLFKLHSGKLLGYACIHGDIKFENYALAVNAIVNLIDWNSALPIMFGEKAVWISGGITRDYAAPEIFNPKTGQWHNDYVKATVYNRVSQQWQLGQTFDWQPKLTTASDIYALGANIQRLLQEEAFQHIKDALSKPAIKKIQTLIQLMTAQQPQDRLDALTSLLFLKKHFPAAVIVNAPIATEAEQQQTRIAEQVLLPFECQQSTAVKIKKCRHLNRHQAEIMAHQGIAGFALLAAEKDTRPLFHRWRQNAQALALQSAAPVAADATASSSIAPPLPIKAVKAVAKTPLKNLRATNSPSH